MDIDRPVLVVHHHPLVVEALDITLCGLGFTVLAAPTYQTALRLLGFLVGDLGALVAHCDMPSEPLAGALLRDVRARHPGAAIVVISARTSAEVGELPEGSVYLAEPFDRAQLVAAVVSARDARAAEMFVSP